MTGASWGRLQGTNHQAVPPDALHLSHFDIQYEIMIRTFRCKDTQALFEGRCPHQWLAVRAQAERRLAQLDAAVTLDFLRAPPSNRLEPLKGDRQGQWSIRVNDRWRVCFTWRDGDAHDVEIVDYH